MGKPMQRPSKPIGSRPGTMQVATNPPVETKPEKPKIPEPELSPEIVELMKLKKGELSDMAENLGVAMPANANKKDLAEKIIEAKKAENPTE